MPTGVERRPQARSEVQSVHRACRLLDVLVERPRTAQSVSELATATGLNRTVVHRLMQTLLAENFVSKRHARYSLGPRSLDISHRYIDSVGIQRAALPYAVSLHEALVGTPWLVSLGVPAGNCIILVDRLWKREAPFNSLMDLGTELPLTRSAAGRCVLAYQPEDPTERYPCELTPALVERLQEIRDAGGVEWSSNELQPGIAALAAAILSRERVAVGAIVVSGPDLDPHLNRDSDLAQQLRRTGVAISKLLP